MDQLQESIGTFFTFVDFEVGMDTPLEEDSISTELYASPQYFDELTHHKICWCDSA